jgi:hypothetical protein
MKINTFTIFFHNFKGEEYKDNFYCLGEEQSSEWRGLGAKNLLYIITIILSLFLIATHSAT